MGNKVYPSEEEVTLEEVAKHIPWDVLIDEIYAVSLDRRGTWAYRHIRGYYHTLNEVKMPKLPKEYWGSFTVHRPKKSWYENIPEHGVLCKVWDDFNDGTTVDIIHSYIKALRHSYRGILDVWENAIPLTLEEAKKYVYKEGGHDEK